MAITPSRFTLGFDRAATSEAAGNRARTSLLRQGMRAAKRKGDFRTALGFSDELNRQGTPYGATGSAADVGSMAQGRVAAREALAGQMRSALAPTREGNIAAAKAAGTFDATRERFNKANTGKKVMDEAGNITDAPKPPTTGPGASPPGPATPPAVGVKPPTPAAAPAALSIVNAPDNQKVSMTRAMEATARQSSQDLLNTAVAEGRVGPVKESREIAERKKPAQMEDWLASQRKSPTTPAVDIQPAARAKGGPVKGGQPYLVGEEGPEIMVPEEDGKIIPNKDLKKKSRKKLSKMLSKR